MRTFTYYLLPPTGMHVGTKVGSLMDLLLDIPYLIKRPNGLVPPLHVINEILSSGIQHAGMSGGCKWEPFQIEEEEFNVLINEFMTGSKGIKYIEPPDWVKTYDDWKAWEAERIHGIPAQEYRPLWAKLKEADESLRKAEEKDDEQLAIKMRKKVKELDHEMTELIMKYVKYNK